MIEYNLRKDNMSNHPLDYKWATLNSGPWMNHLCTVVDNHDEVENGRYTRKPSKLLLHMSPRIRCYTQGCVFQDFYYVGIRNDGDIPTFSNWGYTYEKLSEVQIIQDLKTVLYDLEPLLCSQTLLGHKGHPIWDNPNHFYGDYMLNDENIYHIHRKYDDVTFCSKDGDEICKIKLNKGLFEEAVNLYKRRLHISRNTDRLLTEGMLVEEITSYTQAKNQHMELCKLGGLL